MPWHKPTRVWHWLMLLSPGAVSVAMTGFGKLFLSRDSEITPSLLGLPIALIMCLVIGCILAKGATSVVNTIALAVLITLGLVIVNFAIAFGGCAVINPYFNMH